MNEIKQTITNEATQDERRTAMKDDRLDRSSKNSLASTRQWWSANFVRNSSTHIS
jgi:hypothetical protein